MPVVFGLSVCMGRGNNCTVWNENDLLELLWGGGWWGVNFNKKVKGYYTLELLYQFKWPLCKRKYSVGFNMILETHS
jgi:hypothetical protein